MTGNLAALLLAVERGDAVAVAALRDRLRSWRAGPLLALTGREYRRAKRDEMLAELGALVAPRDAGPATQARRALDRLEAFRRDWPLLLHAPRGSLTAAEALALDLLELGEPIPRARMLRAILARKAATDGVRVATSGAFAATVVDHPATINQQDDTNAKVDPRRAGGALPAPRLGC